MVVMDDVELFLNTYDVIRVTWYLLSQQPCLHFLPAIDYPQLYVV